MSISYQEAYRIAGGVAKELGIARDLAVVVGSVRICHEGNDADILALLSDDSPDPESLGFVADIDDPYGPEFRSYRRGNVNLLATFDKHFFLAEVVAAISASQLRPNCHELSDRGGRTAFHGNVREEVRTVRAALDYRDRALADKAVTEIERLKALMGPVQAAAQAIWSGNQHRHHRLREPGLGYGFNVDWDVLRPLVDTETPND